VNGKHVELINRTDLSAGVGSPILGVFESAPGTASVVIHTGTKRAKPWDVSVHSAQFRGSRDDFRIYIKRTDNGRGKGTITGGTDYIGIFKGGDTKLFSGTKCRDDIGIQIKVVCDPLVLFDAKHYLERLLYTLSFDGFGGNGHDDELPWDDHHDDHCFDD